MWFEYHKDCSVMQKMRKLGYVYLLVSNVSGPQFCGGAKPLISYAMMYHQTHILHFNKMGIHKFLLWTYEHLILYENYDYMYYWTQRRCINMELRICKYHFKTIFQYKYQANIM